MNLRSIVALANTDAWTRPSDYPAMVYFGTQPRDLESKSTFVILQVQERLVTTETFFRLSLLVMTARLIVSFLPPFKLFKPFSLRGVVVPCEPAVTTRERLRG